jgi:hypothetical protein
VIGRHVLKDEHAISVLDVLLKLIAPRGETPLADLNPILKNTIAEVNATTSSLPHVLPGPPVR